MLLTKSIASPEHSDRDNSLSAPHLIVCTFPPVGGAVCAGKLNRCKTGAGAQSQTLGSVYLPSVYSVLCGILTDGMEAVEREQHRRSARSQCVWHRKRSLPSPYTCSNSPQAIGHAGRVRHIRNLHLPSTCACVLSTSITSPCSVVQVDHRFFLARLRLRLSLVSIQCLAHTSSCGMRQTVGTNLLLLLLYSHYMWGTGGLL